MDVYRDLAILVEDAKRRSDEGSVTLTRQLLATMSYYSGVKHRIPSESAWWSRSPAYQNWMTTGALDLHLGVAAWARNPEPTADRLWLEKLVISVLGRTLRDVHKVGGAGRVLSFAESVNQLVYEQASRLQIDEAFLLSDLWEHIADEANRSGDHDESDRDGTGIARLSAAEELAAPIANLWRGLVRGAAEASSRSFGDLFIQGVSSREPVEIVELPPFARSEFERYVAGGREEVRSEGRLVTGGWWAAHFLARFTSEHLRNSYDRIIARVSALNEIVTSQVDRGDAEGAAVTIWASLDLHDRLEYEHGSFQRSLLALKTNQREQTNNPNWPGVEVGETWPRENRDDVLVRLAVLLPGLRTKRHDSSRPDLHGQAYRRLFDETFSRLVHGKTAISATLLTALLAEADVMRARVVADREGLEAIATAALALEPFESVMELSGYALLMQELDGNGVWRDVEAAWDAFLAENGGQPAAIRIVEQHDFYSSPGVGSRTSMGPISRNQTFRTLLDERGGATSGERRNRANRRAPNSPQSISEVFTSGGRGPHDDLADLFIVEYLARHLPDGYELPQHARWLANRLGKRGESDRS
jgi:hypothetical protein